MRIFYYSHDTYGIGHTQRTLVIAEQIASDYPHATQLLVSGTPQPHCSKLPKQLDFIKIPSLDKRREGEFHSPSLLLSLEALKALREKIILETVKYFNPDIVLVDKYPAGAHGEMLSALHYLQRERPETKLILGMSDIEDHAMIARHTTRSETESDLESRAPKVRDLWRRQGAHLLMEELYDKILHYGSREIYDPVSEYRFSKKLGEKMTSCGYIVRTPLAQARDQVRSTLKMKTKQLVVVTAGGGEDGFEFLTSYLEMLKVYRDQGCLPFDSLLIPGPLMSLEKRRKLQGNRSLGLPFSFIDSTSEMSSYLNAADLIVSMGGYNSVCEAISLRKPTIIVPHVKPRVEQLIRAGRFSAHGLVRMIHPEALNSRSLFSKIHDGLKEGMPVSPDALGIEMNGAVNASRAIGALCFENDLNAHSRISSSLEAWDQEVNYF